MAITVFFSTGRQLLDDSLVVGNIPKLGEVGMDVNLATFSRLAEGFGDGVVWHAQVPSLVVHLGPAVHLVGRQVTWKAVGSK